MVIVKHKLPLFCFLQLVSFFGNF